MSKEAPVEKFDFSKIRPAPAEPKMRDLPVTPLSTSPESPASQRQLRYLQAVAREAGLDPAGLDARSTQAFGVEHQMLSRREASMLIDLIQSEDAEKRKGRS